jgi:hypothetical protein
MGLIDKLEDIRAQQGAPMRVFGPSLGITMDGYRHIKAGRRNMGRRLLGNILMQYPELEVDVQRYTIETGIDDTDA